MSNVLLGNDSAVDELSLANRLRPALLKLNRELRREAHALGVSGGQVALLIQIARCPGVGVRELAARERISPGVMSRHVERLVSAGLVERLPDEHDRRRHGLAVTGDGDRVLRSVKRKRTAWLAGRLRALPADDRIALEAAAAALERLLGDAG